MKRGPKPPGVALEILRLLDEQLPDPPSARAIMRALGCSRSGAHLWATRLRARRRERQRRAAAIGLGAAIGAARVARALASRSAG